MSAEKLITLAATSLGLAQGVIQGSIIEPHHLFLMGINKLAFIRTQRPMSSASLALHAFPLSIAESILPSVC
jgi:hypothetical protein